ncbi:MAG: Na+/H+ antiporter NhaA [Halieaceae bacterium]|jgi:NhaA family Na+:H+ antiporter|nr:Na+/H+ antiporter NhaA [Halieaceae bacterium]
MRRFVQDEAVSSIVLFVATVAALLLANTRYAETYFAVVELPIRVAAGHLQLEFHLRSLVNEGLMTLFFLVIGLEIKRELLVGELRDSRLAFTVLAAALGGMAAPAAIYFFANRQEPTLVGWGIPMATDTAFALGMLLLLGHRMPAGLKAFLVAYAIIDDLGAMTVIALFYSHSLGSGSLGAAGLCVLALIICNLAGLRHISIYLLLGVLLWLELVNAGVHGTLAGVLVAAAVPARPKHGRRWFLRTARQITNHLERLHDDRRDVGILGDPEQHAAVEAAEQVSRLAATPLRRWERSLERPVLLLVLPVFALFNAGIHIDSGLLQAVVSSPVSWGIVAGLLLGKVTGIGLLSWLAVKSSLGRLPAGVGMRHVLGVGLLGGMGFTMSIFIAGLSFSSPEQLDTAKAAILSASALAGIGGYLWLRFLTTAEPHAQLNKSL